MSADINTSLNQNGGSQPQTLVDVLTAPCTTGSTQPTSTAPATSTTTVTTSASNSLINSVTPITNSIEQDVKPDIKQEIKMEIKTEQDIKQEPGIHCGKEISQVFVLAQIVFNNIGDGYIKINYNWIIDEVEYNNQNKSYNFFIEWCI